MAAFNRRKTATYEVHENISVDTQDNEDHTFCGIMFPVKCKDLLPLDHLLIKSVAIRGALGPLTVWVSNEEEHVNDRNNNSSNDRLNQRVRLDPRYWTKLYDNTHEPSRRTYKELLLESPIRLQPGQTRVIYIHSTLPGDEAIVYDNSEYGMSSKRYEDDKLAILTGRAHVSNDVFGQEPIWGWGNAWRDRREFVGRLEYGTVYKLWNPAVQPKFGGNFQGGVHTLLMCQRRWESPWSILPDECIYYILNMCRWDWFDDDPDSMKQRRRREKSRLAARAAEEESQRQLQQQAEEVASEAAPMEEEHETDSGSPCPRRRAAAAAAAEIESVEDGGNEDDDEIFEDAQEDGEEVDEEEGDDDEQMEEEWDEDAEEEEDNEDEENWSEDDDEDQYHRANVQSFNYRDLDSDDEEAEAEQLEREQAERDRRAW
eukprot:CAMPEP_0172456816 /NCGR_PEP_ID=MMETSP1065-20121228/17765_1 /TAXON_ID=265537 /ORGANISM="Amphiprora paludosa, Strain CCMP125" /LENGTH=428 /DNA_ID=CAMNT_0013210063 /DNA_START=22 /DNA_END=1305 /DNA_ORIENTATION=-